MYQETMIEAAQAAGELMLTYSNKPFAISSKEGINNLVTEVDHAAEKIIVDLIQSRFPDHSILSEEMGKQEKNSPYKWIIDPIDGTVNFANRIPLCCVSIALEVNGVITAGVVFNPYMNELFRAQKGEGAYLNDQRLLVSKKEKVAESCLVTGFPYSYLEMPNGPLEIFGKMIRNGIPVRRLGSAAIDLCWVAAGRFDGFYEHHLQAWDAAAGMLMVQEAGGKVSDFYGKEYSVYQPQILATNGLIHQEMLKEIGWMEAEK